MTGYCQLIEESLEDEGYKVIKSYDGLGVLEKINNYIISLFILDIMMPNMDGLMYEN